jgi:transcriptional regulator with XRE-family HTH domain
VDGRRAGSILRAVRLHLGFRQVDVAAAARVSQSVVSRAERGRLDRISVEQLDRIGEALRVRFFLDGRWLDGDVGRLIDRAHASIVEVVVEVLRRDGWEVLVEFGFNHYGDRGSVDVLAWHPGERALLIVEVKSRLTDLQATFLSYDRKVRLVPMLVRRDRGWDIRHVGRLLVMPGSSANRSVVAAHPATFASAFPERMPAIRAWLRRPSRALGGVWFLSSMPHRTTKHALRARRTPTATPTSGGRA